MGRKKALSCSHSPLWFSYLAFHFLGEACNAVSALLCPLSAGWPCSILLPHKYFALEGLCVPFAFVLRKLLTCPALGFCRWRVGGSTFLIRSYRFIWRRQRYPTPVLLPGESHGRRSLVGCSPWGREESDTTERLHFHFSVSCILEKEMATHSSVLAWRIPGTGEPGGLPSMGSHRVGYD